MTTSSSAAPISVFSYRDAREFLQDWLSQQRRLDAKFSIRQWAKRMEISHALLVMLLNGKRQLLVKHVDSLAKGMDLSTPERLYLLNIIKLPLSEGEDEKKGIEALLEKNSPGGSFRVREIDEFKILSNWLHFAILAFLETGNAIREVDAILPWFEHVAPKSEILSAFTRLFSFGLITRDHTGRFHTKYDRITSKDDVASRGAREYYKQISHLATRAVDEQSVLEREIQSFSLAIDPAKIPLAKEMIRNFRTEFSKAMGDGNSREVYQTNLQFFRLSKRTENRNPLISDESPSLGAPV